MARSGGMTVISVGVPVAPTPCVGVMMVIGCLLGSWRAGAGIRRGGGRAAPPGTRPRCGRPRLPPPGRARRVEDLLGGPAAAVDPVLIGEGGPVSAQLVERPVPSAVGA